MKRPSASTFFSLLSVNVLLSGFSFVTTLTIAYLMGSKEYGEYSYAITLGAYVSTITWFGFDQTLVRDLSYDENETVQKTFIASMLLRAGLFVIAAAALLILNIFSAPEDKLSVVGLTIVLLDGVKSFYIAQWYDVFNQIKRHAVYFLVERLIYFAVIWYFVLLYGARFKVVDIALAMATSTGVSFILQYRYARPVIKWEVCGFIWELMRRLAVHNVWIWIAAISTLSFGGLSKIVLEHVSGSSSLGRYSVAWQIVPLGMLVTTQVVRIGYPRLARVIAQRPEPPQLTVFFLRYLAVAGVAASCIAAPAIIAPSSLIAVVGSQYTAAAAPLRILGFYVIAVGLGQVATQYLICTHRGRLYSIISVTTGAFSSILLLLLVPILGGVGAAISVLVAHGAAIIIFLILVAHSIRSRRWI